MEKLHTTDMSDIWDKVTNINTLGTISVAIPQIGAFVQYQGKSYEILTTVTYQENSGEASKWLPKATITTFCTILEITDECDDAGKATITVRSDDLRLI